MLGCKKTINAALAMLVLAMGVSAAAPAFADAGFQKWIRDFRSVAVSNGVSGQVYDRAFANVRTPDPEVLRKARFQPEFRDEAWQYLDNRVNERTVAEGQRMLRKYRRLLNRIERSTGVSKHIVLAIWSMESSYGEALKQPGRLHYVPRALATLAYADRRRARFARNQLIGALKIAQRGDVPISGLTGSWAGAMGHTQFIPTSYMAYALDGDGDGRKDIWNSVPDALYTAANLLRRNGWKSGQTWGYEVILPPGRKFPGGKLTLREWERLGVVRANGRDYPRPGQKAELKVLQGRDGPAFLMVDNFFVIKRYNNADKYALGVGLLADQIGGYPPPRKDWTRPFTRLSVAESEELQIRLARKGLYEGDIDGKIGPMSRSAIKAFQARAGLPQDGFASMEVLEALRRF
ncbi:MULTISPECIES: lytic murein transglycosylase [unclassified Roseitalea]|uniref:lytic murein transglycosylase n=1 Tax=unclassified Roseitalea TaxID=2639107 RepID=UPI0027400CF0|nr:MULTISPECIES: lytic murein transglycosylase [unclassified Roseitalea]